MTKFEKEMRKRIQEEKTIKRFIKSGDNLERLIRAIKNNQDYALEGYKYLCKRAFLDKELSNIFYSIILYIEKLYFGGCSL